MGTKLLATLVILFAAGPVAHAAKEKVAACEAQAWKIEGKTHQLCYSIKLDARISAECETKPCGAATLLNAAAKETPSKTRRVTSNPGSEICTRIKGEVQLARNDRGTEMAVCEAKDGTVVDLISLSEAYR